MNSFEREQKMSTITVQSRVSPELKKQADAIFAAMGLSTADAIRLFLQQVVNIEGLPFQPTARRLNAETRAAMQEIENGGGQVFKTTNELQLVRTGSHADLFG